MKEKISNAIERLIHLPIDFHTNGHVSEVALLKASGYFELHNQITEDKIIEILKVHPHVIAEWLQWSEDNRSSNRWGFSRGDNGKCSVGHWPEDKEFEEINTNDEFYACAAFIKREAESTRILFEKKTDSIS